MSNKFHTVTVQGGYNKGGYSFQVLNIPNKNKYQFVDLKKIPLGDDVYWHGYIQAKELKNQKLPLDANPRKPQPTKVVKLMQATLQKTPQDFHHLNNGITIIARDIQFNPDTKVAEILFDRIDEDRGDGVCNGGHTYFAIEQFATELPDNALVRIELIVLSKKLTLPEYAKKVKNIAEKRNAHNELQSITTAHFAGFYNPFIEYLDEMSIYIQWFEGDPNAVKSAEKVDAFIAKLMAISPHWFSHYLNSSGNTGNHMSAARNIGSSHKKWEKEVSYNNTSDKTMYYMIPLIKDILFLRDTISHSLYVDDFKEVAKRWNSTKLWKYLKSKDTIPLHYKKDSNGGELLGYNLAHTFITMLLGSFRENVWFSYDEEGNINYVGWLINPETLWNNYKTDLLKALNQIASTINAPSFGNAFLQNPAIYGYQMTQYEFGARLDRHVCEPEIIYDINSENKYIKTDKSILITHTLLCDYLESGLAPIANIVTGINDKGKTFYRHA
jgi:hypothetical protein